MRQSRTFHIPEQICPPDGTNADEGRAILKEHESDRLISRPKMLEAARTAVELAK